MKNNHEYIRNYIEVNSIVVLDFQILKCIIALIFIQMFNVAQELWAIFLNKKLSKFSTKEM